MEKIKKYIILVAALQSRTWPKSLQLYVEVSFVFGENVGIYKVHYISRLEGRYNSQVLNFSFFGSYFCLQWQL